VGECTVDDLAADDIFCIAEPSGLGAPYFASCRFAACLPDPLHGDLGVQFSESVEHLTQRRIAALLLEAVIFRVTRILEEFHQESAIERVFLSGGVVGIDLFAARHRRLRAFRGPSLAAKRIQPAGSRAACSRYETG